MQNSPVGKRAFWKGMVGNAGVIIRFSGQNDIYHLEKFIYARENFFNPPTFFSTWGVSMGYIPVYLKYKNAVLSNYLVIITDGQENMKY